MFFFLFTYFSFHSFIFFLVFFVSFSINVNCFRRKIKSFLCCKSAQRVFILGMRLWRVGHWKAVGCWNLLQLVSLDGFSYSFNSTFVYFDCRVQNRGRKCRTLFAISKDVGNKKALLNHESVVYLWSHYSNVYISSNHKLLTFMLLKVTLKCMYCT